MGFHVPRKVSFIALIALFLGVLLAYSLRGVYIITLFTFKDKIDVFPTSELQEYVHNNGGELQMVLKAQQSGINPKNNITSSDWDFAVLVWYSTKVKGMDVYQAKSEPNLAGMTLTYSVPFTPGCFNFVNVWLSVKGWLDRTLDLTTRPLKKAQQIHLNPDFIEKVKEKVAAVEGPVHMINFLKFKEDGGSWEYFKYSSNVMLHLFPLLGGRISVSGTAEDGYWDSVAIATYPNFATLLEMVESETWNAGYQYRKNGLEDTLVLSTRAQN